MKRLPTCLILSAVLLLSTLLPLTIDIAWLGADAPRSVLLHWGSGQRVLSYSSCLAWVMLVSTTLWIELVTL